MSKRSLFVAIVLGCTAAAAAQPAYADPPGSPLPGVLSNPQQNVIEANAFLNDNPAAGEVTSRMIANPFVSGYLVMLKGLPCTGSNLATPSTWSDIVVFWNGVNLPAATDGVTTPAANQITLISDPPDGVAHVGCSATHFPADPTVPVAKVTDPGYQNLPAGLAGLTENIILAGPVTAQIEIGAGNVTYKAAATGGQTNVYRIFSEVPALPPWAFALLGGTLLGTAVVVVRRRGREVEATAV